MFELLVQKNPEQETYPLMFRCEEIPNLDIEQTQANSVLHKTKAEQFPKLIKVLTT